MTFVGKILVIVIMAFALLFLGLSTVVFTTHTNWKEAVDKKWKPDLDKLKTQSNELGTQLATAKDELKKAEDLQKQQNAKSEDLIAKRDDEVKTRQNEARALQQQVEVAQQAAKTALDEAELNRKEAERLREQKSAIDKVANDFKLQQIELNDKIRELERQNKTLDDNAKDLRDKAARFSTLLRRNGLSDDITNIKGTETPPPVEGEVAKVDATNRRIEITIGSDDGLAVDHELYLFRTKPQPEYLGRVRIVSVDPDQAVAKVIGNTVQGKKIKEGDSVSSTLRTR